jgi:hypothetical protein
MAEQTVEDYVASLAGPVRDIVDALVDVIDAAVPDAECQVWDGSPVWRLGLPGTLALCVVTAHPTHVAFGIFRGHEVADPSGRLDTRPGALAHVKLHTTADVDPALFADWLHQARDAELFTDWLRHSSTAAAA